MLLTGTLLCLAPNTFGAEEQTSEHTIVGLFSPDREQDLRDLVADLPDVKLVSVDYDNARATFRYDVAALFPNHDPKKPPTAVEIEQRLSRLLTEASMGTFSLKLTPAVPKDKLTKIEMTVGMLDCKGCRYAMYLTVTRVAGVERATVGKDNVVTAWIDPTKTDQTAVENAVKKLERK
jgi:hypothetical protein